MQQTLSELLLPPNCASSSVVGYQALRSGEHVYCDGGWIVSVSALNYSIWDGLHQFYSEAELSLFSSIVSLAAIPTRSVIEVLQKHPLNSLFAFCLFTLSCNPTAGP